MSPDEGMGGMMGGLGEPPGAPENDEKMVKEEDKTPPERNVEAREAKDSLPFKSAPGKLTKERPTLILDRWQESKHKRDKKGRFSKMEESKTGKIGVGKGALAVVLEWGKDKPEFSSDTASKGHDRHHQSHADEMGISYKEWKRRAADLLNAPKSNDFLDW